MVDMVMYEIVENFPKDPFEAFGGKRDIQRALLGEGQREGHWLIVEQQFHDTSLLFLRVLFFLDLLEFDGELAAVEHAESFGIVIW